MILRLPVPPSPNRWPKHPLGLQSAKNRYRKKAWARAVAQVKPLHDPPLLVKVSAMFLLWRERDEDNLKGGSMKWILDCLKQKQFGNCYWRQGICDQMGYFIDDDPTHMKLGEVWQNKASRNIQEVVVEIETLDAST